MVVICEIHCLNPSEQGCMLSHFSHVHLFTTPWNGSLPGSSVHGDSPGKNTGVVLNEPITKNDILVNLILILR